MQEIHSLTTNNAYAFFTAQTLTSGVKDSLQKTLELLSASGVKVTGSPGDDNIYVEAKNPWKTGISIRAGQAIAFHELIASGVTFSLRELLTLYQQLSHVQPDLRANVRGFAEGLLEELAAEDRNPVWAALVLAGTTPEISPIRTSLQEISRGIVISDITDAALDPIQLIMIILRMRQEAAGMLEILDSDTQIAPSMDLQSFRNPRLVTTRPCEFDSPLSDAGAKGVSKAVGLGFKAFIKSYGDRPIWKDPEGRALTGKEASQLISAISFWSSLLNLVLAKATTQLDLKVTPDPLTRTKERKAGHTGIVEVHAHRSGVPAGKYAVCAERMLAALGTSFKAEPGDLGGVLATFRLQPGQPVMLTDQDVIQWTRRTDEQGVAKTSIVGRPQKEEIPDTFEEVTKEATVAVSVNPDTAEKWWETTFAAVVDAVQVAKLFRRLTPAPDPVVGLTGVTNVGLRAANYFGWLNNSLSFRVRDWEPRKVLRYSVAVQSETNIPRSRCQVGHNEKLDYRLEAEVPLTARTEADGATSLIGRAPLRWVAGVHDDTVTYHTGEMSGCNSGGAAGGGAYVCTVPPSGVYTSTVRVTSLIDGEMGVEVRNYGKRNQEVRINLSPDTTSWAYDDTTVPAENKFREQNWHCEPPVFPPSYRGTDFLNLQQWITAPDLAAPLKSRLDRYREPYWSPRFPYEFVYTGFVDGVGSWAGLGVGRFPGAGDVRVRENLEIHTPPRE